MEQQPVSTSEPAAKRWTTRELLAWTTNFLKEKTVESPRTLAEMLLSSVLGCERLRLYMEVDRIASPEELSALRALVVRAGRHEPIQFLLGQWSFHGREFEVAPCTLIPRPETELLVDDALRWTREALDRGEFSSAIRCADVGTGTGCIVISYAAAVRGILKSGGGGCRPLGGPVTKSAPVEALPVIDVSAEERAAQPALVVPSQPLTLQVIASDIVADAIVLAKRNAARRGGAEDLRDTVFRGINVDHIGGIEAIGFDKSLLEIGIEAFRRHHDGADDALFFRHAQKARDTGLGDSHFLRNFGLARALDEMEARRPGHLAQLLDVGRAVSPCQRRGGLPLHDPISAASWTVDLRPG